MGPQIRDNELCQTKGRPGSIRRRLVLNSSLLQSFPSFFGLFCSNHFIWPLCIMATPCGCCSRALNARWPAGAQVKGSTGEDVAAPCRRAGPVRRSGAPEPPGRHRTGPSALRKQNHPPSPPTPPGRTLPGTPPAPSGFSPTLLYSFCSSQACDSIEYEYRYTGNCFVKICMLHKSPVVSRNRAPLCASSGGNIMPMGLSPLPESGRDNSLRRPERQRQQATKDGAPSIVLFFISPINHGKRQSGLYASGPAEPQLLRLSLLYCCQP